MQIFQGIPSRCLMAYQEVYQEGCKSVSGRVGYRMDGATNLLGDNHGIEATELLITTLLQDRAMAHSQHGTACAMAHFTM